MFEFRKAALAAGEQSNEVLSGSGFSTEETSRLNKGGAHRQV